mgnify:FL=1
MKREELIQLLEESAANNLAVARQLVERAGYFDRVGEAADADCVRKVAARARFSAGCNVAMVNHLKGVSPE